MHVDTGPGLGIEKSCVIEIENYLDTSSGSKDVDTNGALENGSSTDGKKFDQLTLHDGIIEFPAWANDITSILWIPVHAVSDKLARGSSAGMR